jgi:hypothetical protein
MVAIGIFFIIFLAIGFAVSGPSEEESRRNEAILKRQREDE